VKGLLKAALFVLPFALVFLGIRWLSGGEAERWRDRVEPHCRAPWSASTRRT